MTSGAIYAISNTEKLYFVKMTNIVPRDQLNAHVRPLETKMAVGRENDE
jgi:hypothetical protein